MVALLVSLKSVAMERSILAQWSFFRIATDERETRGGQSPQIYISNVVISSDSKVWKESECLARGGIGQRE